MNINNFSYILIIFLVHINYPLQLFALTSNECQTKGGVVTEASQLGANACKPGKSIGKVNGLDCLCECCIGVKKIDCDKNFVEILSVCKKASKLEAQIKFSGTEEPEKIDLYLESRNVGGFFVVGSISLKLKKQILSIPADHEKDDISGISTYRIHYKGTTHSQCNYPSPKLKFPVEKCLDSSSH